MFTVSFGMTTRRFTAVVALFFACGDSTGTSDGGTGGATAASASTSDGASSSGGGSTSNGGTGSGGGSSSGAPTTGSMPADDCSSDIFWTKGDFESPLMHPGRACLTCHSTVVGEDVQNLFAIAGTVYPTLHEVDDCNGAAAADLKVVITTADQQTLTLAVNSAGNFMYDQQEFGPIMFPIKAKVVQGDAEIAMAAAQMSGDCNSCHTELGMNGAPGRILAP